MNSLKLSKILQTRLLILGLSSFALGSLMLSASVAAETLPNVNYKTNINLINDIAKDYTGNIKKPSKKRKLSKRQKSKILKRTSKRKEIPIDQLLVLASKRLKIGQKPRARKHTKHYSQRPIIDIENCVNNKTSLTIRRGVKKRGSCFDIAPDVLTYNHPVNMNSDYLGLGLDYLGGRTESVDLGVDTFELRNSTLFGKSIHVMDR